MTLLETISALADAFDGRCGVAVFNVTSGEETLLRAEESYPTASAIKLAILTTLMALCEQHGAEAKRRQYSLDEPLALRQADKVGGSGILQHLTPGLTMTVRDWAFLMMNLSDNTATNVLIDYVGLENVADWLNRSGFPDVRLHRKIDFSDLPADKKYFGTATPRALNRLMTAVFCREIVSPAACDEMLRLMANVGQERVGRYLPFEPWGSAVPDDQKLQLAGKTGSIVGVRTQTAAVWRGAGTKRKGFVLTVMTDGNSEPERWSADAPGVLLIGRLARAVYDALEL